MNFSPSHRCEEETCESTGGSIVHDIMKYQGEAEDRKDKNQCAQGQVKSNGKVVDEAE